jgi:hypothetical protein
MALVRIFLDHDFLNCSALHQNSDIINNCNLLRSKEDDQFKGEPTAVSRVVVFFETLHEPNALPGTLS